MLRQTLPFWYLACSLILLSFLFWPNLNGPFVLDDSSNIQPLIPEDSSLSSIWHSLAKDGLGLHQRPVAKLSFIITSLLHGEDPWGFKYHNLLTHHLTALLLFWLTGRFLSRFFTYNQAWTIASITTIFWLIAPIQVSTTLYPVQRMAQLSALFTAFGLLCLSFFLDYLEQGKLKPAFCFGFFGFPLALVLATFSKPNGTLLILYALLAIWLTHNSYQIKKPAVKFYFLFIACLTVPLSAGLLYFISHWSDFVDYSMRTFTLEDRLLTQLNAMVFYIKIIYFPVLNNLTLFHDDFPISRTWDLDTIKSALILFLMLLTAFLCRKKHTVISFGLLWFFIGHLLESTVFQLEMVFEHRNYFASFGLFLIISYLISIIDISKIIKNTTLILSFILLITLTTVRANTWRSEELLFSINVKDHPNSVRAQANMANMLLKQNKLDLARLHLINAVNLNSTEAGSLLHLLATFCYDAEQPGDLVRQAKKVLENGPISAYGIASLSTLNQRQKLGMCPGIPVHTTLELMTVALKFNQPKHNLEFLYRLKAQSLAMNGQTDNAIDFFEQAYQVDFNTPVLMELLDYQISQNRRDQALATIAKIRQSTLATTVNQKKIKRYKELLNTQDD